MANPRDVTIPSADGTALRAWYWSRPEPRAALVIAHGLGEHSGCYTHVAEALSPALDIDALAFDFRGHGRSPGPRGFVRRYDDLVDDLRATLAWIDRERPGLPRYVLGHSNGGQVALRAAIAGEPVAGLILSNPALRLMVEVPTWKRRVGEVLLRVAPGVTMGGDLPDEWMTRDAEHLLVRRADALRHSRISAPLFFGMLAGGPLIAEGAAGVTAPVLVLLGEADPVIDGSATRAMFERLGSRDKMLKAYPEMLHEPLNDTDRQLVIDDIIAWLAPRLERLRSGE